MNWKLIVGIMVVPYAIAALVTGAMYLNADIGSNPNEDTSSIASFLNASGNPQQIIVDQPTVGSGQTRVSGTLGYPTNPGSWLKFLARSATLQGPIWEPWTAPIRFFLYIGPGVLMGLITLQLIQSASFFFGGLFGRGTP